MIEHAGRSAEAHADILQRLHEVDRAIVQHAQWLARLNRQLICGGVGNADDLADDAHLRCQLGHWLHGPEHARGEQDPSHAALEAAHQSMHAIARHLLDAQAGRQAIAPADYDALVAVASRVRQLLRRKEQELTERLGAVDKLTGLWNRQAVHLRLAEEIERVQRTRQPCAVCFVDLDDFAKINQAHGQLIGDAALKASAGFFASHLRGYDTLFRLGGEEFLLCLPNIDLDQAGVLINRLREKLATHPFAVENRLIQLTASFGVVNLEPIFFIEETLERVERAQLIAKSEGGNRVCVWHDGFAAEAAS
jgi:diguanylate cyclase (GGDEF)-like protein